MYKLPSEILLRRSTPIKRPYYSSLVLYALAYINTIVHLCSALLRVQQMIINIKLKKKTMKKIVFCSGKSARNVVTITKIGRTKHISIVYASGICESLFYKI